MCDTSGWRWKTERISRGRVAVDLDDLLELVEHEHDPPVALARELPGELEQPLHRRDDVRGGGVRAEAEAEIAAVGVDRHGRRDPQALEHAQPLLGAEQGRGEVLVDRLRELVGEPAERRRRHQIDVGDERAAAHELLRRPPDERRLPEAPRREQDDVLPGERVGLQLGELTLPVGERLIERERAEAERVEAAGRAASPAKDYTRAA